MQLISSPVQMLTGNVDLPGDKSLSHRAILFASLAEGESYIDNFLSAGVTEVMFNALKTLGVRITRVKNTLKVQGCGIGGYLTPGKDLVGRCSGCCRYISSPRRFVATTIQANGADH
jgi:3-phosphoshikimate 1-carboxyvinyltransferase